MKCENPYYAPIVWVLDDQRPGNTNQSVGLAEALAVAYEYKTVQYDQWAVLANILKWNPLWGVLPSSVQQLISPWPDIVISSGRKLAPVALAIKQKAPGRTRLIHMMYPNMLWHHFDMLVLPEHDQPAQKDNVVTVIGALHRVTAAKLRTAAAEWYSRFSHLPARLFGVIIGGDTRYSRFREENARELIDKVNQMAVASGAGLLVTTSRRTPDYLIPMLESRLTVPYYLKDWRDSQENPYMGILALSEALIVTGDSTSMCTEACATGRPVFIYSPKHWIHSKHDGFHKTLYKHGYAKPLTGVFSTWRYEPLMEAERVASLFRQQFPDIF